MDPHLKDEKELMLMPLVIGDEQIASLAVMQASANFLQDATPTDDFLTYTELVPTMSSSNRWLGAIRDMILLTNSALIFDQRITPDSENINAYKLIKRRYHWIAAFKALPNVFWPDSDHPYDFLCQAIESYKSMKTIDTSTHTIRIA